jgi:hypothetical protein
VEITQHPWTKMEDALPLLLKQPVFVHCMLCFLSANKKEQKYKERRLRAALSHDERKCLRQENYISKVGRL